MTELSYVPETELTGFGGKDTAVYVGFARRTKAGWLVSRAGRGGAGTVVHSERAARAKLRDWLAVLIEDSREQDAADVPIIAEAS